MSDNEKSFLCSIQVQAFVDKRRASHCAICVVSFIQFFVGRGYSFYSIPPFFIKQQTESLIKNCFFLNLYLLQVGREYGSCCHCKVGIFHKKKIIVLKLKECFWYLLYFYLFFKERRQHINSSKGVVIGLSENMGEPQRASSSGLALCLCTICK